MHCPHTSEQVLRQRVSTTGTLQCFSEAHCRCPPFAQISLCRKDLVFTKGFGLFVAGSPCLTVSQQSAGWACTKTHPKLQQAVHKYSLDLNLNWFAYNIIMYNKFIHYNNCCCFFLFVVFCLLYFVLCKVGVWQLQGIRPSAHFFNQT